VAFDCFGTLAEFSDRHYIEAFDEICGVQSVDIHGKDLWDRWLEEGRQLWKERGRDPNDPLTGPEPEFLSYRQTWASQFERSFGALGHTGDGVAACGRLLALLGSATAFPEVSEVAATLRRSYRLAVMSNADDDFLQAFLESNGLDFEVVVSSEGTRSYKPRALIFQHLCQRLGLAPHEVLYVGDSPIADLLGARAAGLAIAWINRSDVKLPERIPPPDIELHDLRELLDVLPLLTPPESRVRRSGATG
jgi:2-haloalkanoic acid dehalogenase type II